jgi:hypothetical protein
MSDINKFIYGSDDDIQLRQQLVQIANTFECRNEKNEWVSYFNNPANSQSLKEAMAKYGLPPKNRPATKSGNLFGRWTDYCDWTDTFRFYFYAKISQDFPALNPEQKTNCYLIKGYIDALQSEKVNANDLYAASGDKEIYILQSEVINDKITYFNTLYSNMLCDTYFADQEKMKLEEERKKALEQSQKINIDTFQKTAGTSGGGTKIGLYVFGGVAALIGIMFLARNKAA